MLPRAYRLKRSRIFDKTLASGKIICQNPGFLVLGLKRAFESDTPTRFGFIVSKKVSNRANRRNKVKRRLREIVRELLLQPSWKDRFSGYIAVVVIARKEIQETPFGAVRTLLLECKGRR